MASSSHVARCSLFVVRRSSLVVHLTVGPRPAHRRHSRSDAPKGTVRKRSLVVQHVTENNGGMTTSTPGVAHPQSADPG
ncbi:MAG TPA: hypothetical protein VIG75_01780, partial [Citricoccus sp.]